MVYQTVVETSVVFFWASLDALVFKVVYTITVRYKETIVASKKPDDPYLKSTEQRLQRVLRKLKGQKKRYAFLVWHKRPDIPGKKPALSVDLVRHLKKNRHCAVSLKNLPLLMKILGLLDDRGVRLAEDYLENNPIKTSTSKKSAPSRSNANGKSLKKTIAEMCKHVGLTVREEVHFGYKGNAEYRWDIMATNEVLGEDGATSNGNSIVLLIEAKSQSTDGTIEDKMRGSIQMIDSIVTQFLHNEELLDDNLLNAIGD